MRSLLRGAAIGALVAACAVSGPAPTQAAQRYSIPASGIGPGLTISRQSFAPFLGPCNPSTPLNGIDAVIVRTPYAAGTVMEIPWSGVVAPVVGRLAPTFLSATCHEILPAAPVTGNLAPGVMRVKIPAGTAYFVVEAVQTANVSLTI